MVLNNQAQRIATARDYCQDCVKFKKGQCLVFKELYPLWGKGECWSRETNQERWEETLLDIEAYSSVGSSLQEKQSLSNRIKARIEQEIKEPGSLDDWYEVYESEVNKPLAKPGGGGEAADKVNKAFGPQQMKDNRFMHRKRNPRKYRD